MAYVDIDEFTAYVGSEIVADSSFLQAALDAAEEAVNEHCARSFAAPTGDSQTRYYVAEGDVVVTHDFVDSTNLAVAEDGTTVDASSFQLEPRNVSWSGQARPFHQIRRLPGGCWYRNGAEATVAVTSTRWGWPAVPAQVVEATKILAKDIAHIRSNRFGVAGFGDFGVIRVRDNPHVVMLLSHLRHPMAFGIA